MKLSAVSQKKYVFVCGLHRSGTTILANSLAKLEHSTIFRNTGAIMDEGQFLQNVYPPDPYYGGAGVFGFNPAAHLTENSALMTDDNANKLRASFQAYWNDEQICIEKTPANIIMTRFLQKAFENAYFVVIRRNPVAVSLATQKWRRTSLHKLFEHWLKCHEIFQEDKPYLNRVYELTYEEYVENPGKCLSQIAAFIGAAYCERRVENVEDHNARYFAQWRFLLTRSVFRRYFRYIARKYQSRFNAHNYSLTDGFCAVDLPLEENHKIADAAGACACLLTDAGCTISRFAVLTRNKLRALRDYGRVGPGVVDGRAQ